MRIHTFVSVITTRSNIKSFHGILLVLSILASLFAFQDHSAPSGEQSERARTEWVSSRKIAKRAFAYEAFQCDEVLVVFPADWRFVELNYSRKIKTTMASIMPPVALPCRVVPEKTIAGLPDSNPTHKG